MCLYQYLKKSKHGNKSADKPFKKIYNFLKHDRPKRKRVSKKDTLGIFNDCVQIEERPKIVRKRMRHMVMLKLIL